MSARTTLATWSLAIIGGASGTILANTSLHFWNQPAAVVRPTGSLIAASSEMVVVRDLTSSHGPVYIDLAARLIASSTESAVLRSGIKAIGPETLSWNPRTHQFWSTTTATVGSRLFDSVIMISSGQGDVVRQLYRSTMEYLSNPSESPTRDQAAYLAQRPSGPRDVSLVSGAANTARRVEAGDGFAFWRADGKAITYSCFPSKGSPQLCTYDTVRKRQHIVPVAAYSDFLGPSFSPDGKRIVVTAAGGPFITPSVVVVDSKSGKIMATKRDAQSATSPVYSPDGHFIAYIGPNGVEVCRADLSDCQLVFRGDYGSLQWTRDNLRDFGLP